MWLEWIVEEGNKLFSDVSLWMKELLFLDEEMDTDVFTDSVLQSNGSVMETASEPIGFPISIEEIEEDSVLQKAIFREATEDISPVQKEEFVAENAEEMVVKKEKQSSVWQIFGAYEDTEFMEETEPSAVWSEGFSETNWLEGGIEKVPQKSIELEQIQMEEQQMETKSEAKIKEENRRDTVNETKIVENTSTEFDINLLMEAFEKKLWTARQKGSSRLIQR